MSNRRSFVVSGNFVVAISSPTVRRYGVAFITMGGRDVEMLYVDIRPVFSDLRRVPSHLLDNLLVKNGERHGKSPLWSADRNEETTSLGNRVGASNISDI